jgi:hypothetical protein
MLFQLAVVALLALTNAVQVKRGGNQPSVGRKRKQKSIIFCTVFHTTNIQLILPIFI